MSEIHYLYTIPNDRKSVYKYKGIEYKTTQEKSFLVSSCIERIMILLLFAKDSYSLFSFPGIIEQIELLQFTSTYNLGKELKQKKVSLVLFIRLKSVLDLYAYQNLSLLSHYSFLFFFYIEI